MMPAANLRLWQIDARSALSETLNTLENKPIYAPDDTPLNLPVAFANGLTLIGYDVTAQPDQPIESGHILAGRAHTRSAGLNFCACA